MSVSPPWNLGWPIARWPQAACGSVLTSLEREVIVQGRAQDKGHVRERPGPWPSHPRLDLELRLLDPSPLSNGRVQPQAGRDNELSGHPLHHKK